MITLNSFKNNLAVFSEFLASTSSHQHITTMTINQLLTTLLAMAPSTALSAIFTSGIPEEHASAVKKVVLSTWNLDLVQNLQQKCWVVIQGCNDDLETHCA